MKTTYYILLFFCVTNLMFAQSKITITATNTLTIPMYAQICADSIIVKEGGELIAEDSSGICNETEIRNSGFVSLPVELQSFTAALVDKQVVLKWITATEINNYGFAVERKADNKEWDQIGFVAGYGNSSSPISYSFTDNHINGGRFFQYRLKQTDLNGDFEYSEVLAVEFSPKEFELSQNYPNPFNPSTTIKYQLPVESNISIKVYDILGAEVVSLINEKKQPGIYEVVFDATGLTSGTYIYRIIAGNFVETRKMIILR